MTRGEYAHEIRKLQKARKFRGNLLPKWIYNYGFEHCKDEPQVWIVERVLFWFYAYDKSHKWTEQDFIYEVNDKAYEKAKAHRKAKRESNKALATKIHNKPRPFAPSETRWEECNGPPMDLINDLMKGE